MIKFAERLKELRKDKNLTQTGLAREIGYSQAAIARWEAGLQLPNIEILFSLAMYFKVSADYLIGLED